VKQKLRKMAHKPKIEKYFSKNSLENLKRLDAFDILQSLGKLWTQKSNYYQGQ
jgi:hypothetical protein